MTGEKFLRGLITPIDPKNIFFMLQSGYPADFLLGLTVESLNGVRNRSTAAGAVREADPEFTRALHSCAKCRPPARSGCASRRTRPKLDRRGVLPARRRARRHRGEDGGNPAVAQAAPRPAEIRAGLFPGARRGNELAVNSRSMLQIMQAFASYLDVPEAHVKDCTACPALEHLAAGTRPAQCGFTAARASRPAPSPPCTTATIGSGLITATGKPSARSRLSCSSSRSRKPAAPNTCP